MGGTARSCGGSACDSRAGAERGGRTHVPPYRPTIAFSPRSIIRFPEVSGWPGRMFRALNTMITSFSGSTIGNRPSSP